jgi:excisionase family DNA binding protein
VSELAPLLTHLTLAPLLGVTPRTVAEMCRRGEIPAAKLGRVWVVTRSDLLGHLERRRRARQGPRAEGLDADLVRLALPPPRRRARALAESS